MTKKINSLLVFCLLLLLNFSSLGGVWPASTYMGTEVFPLDSLAALKTYLGVSAAGGGTLNYTNNKVILRFDSFGQLLMSNQTTHAYFMVDTNASVTRVDEYGTVETHATNSWSIVNPGTGHSIVWTNGGLYLDALYVSPVAVTNNDVRSLTLAGSFSGAFDGTVSGTGTALTWSPASFLLSYLAQGGATNSQVLGWNGTSWNPLTIPSTSLNTADSNHLAMAITNAAVLNGFGGIAVVSNGLARWTVVDLPGAVNTNIVYSYGSASSFINSYWRNNGSGVYTNGTTVVIQRGTGAYSGYWVFCAVGASDTPYTVSVNLQTNVWSVGYASSHSGDGLTTLFQGTVLQTNIWPGIPPPDFSPYALITVTASNLNNAITNLAASQDAKTITNNWTGVPIILDTANAKTNIYGGKLVRLGERTQEGISTTASGTAAHAEGFNTTASGQYSHAEGSQTTASGDYSHAAGRQTTASGQFSEATGNQTLASGIYSRAAGSGSTATNTGAVAEGYTNLATGVYSHAEGSQTTASGDYSHSEGLSTVASGNYSHAEGITSDSAGDYSHAEGNTSTANGFSSHAEGNSSSVGDLSHSEGSEAVSRGIAAHAEGGETAADGDYSHSEGYANGASAQAAHSEGTSTTASGPSSHAEGDTSTASGIGSHAENNAIANGNYSHAEGTGTSANISSHAEGSGTTSGGDYSHAEGTLSSTTGNSAHAEGYGSSAGGDYAHAEGSSTAGGYSAHSEGSGSSASGIAAHAEGTSTTAQGDYTHAEGNNTFAGGTSTHAEGVLASASATGSHAEGSGTATGNYSHAEGSSTTVNGISSHVEGDNTSAVGNYSHAGGQNAHAAYNHTFVWSDGTGSVSATATNQVTMSAKNGYRFLDGPFTANYTNIPLSAVTNAGNAAAANTNTMKVFAASNSDTATTATGISGGALATVTNIAQNTVLFLTRNLKFVDAGNGSDGSDGSMGSPWATVAHAQTSTTAGWTLALAPGSYSDTATNSKLNYYLSEGTSMGFNFHDGTNNIRGSGTITSAWASNSVVDVECANFLTGAAGVSFMVIQKSTVSIKARTIGNYDSLTTYGSSGLDFNMESGSVLNLNCDTLYVGQIAGIPSDTCRFNVKCQTLYFTTGDGTGDWYGYTDKSSIIADVGHNFDISGGLGYSGFDNNFIWGVKMTDDDYGSGWSIVPPSFFGNNMIFLGTPIFFDGFTYGFTGTGAYQVY